MTNQPIYGPSNYALEKLLAAMHARSVKKFERSDRTMRKPADP